MSPNPAVDRTCAKSRAVRSLQRSGLSMNSDATVIAEVEKTYAGVPKPEHFTNYLHCEECAEHDQTLLSCDRDTLSLQHVGNPGWDPLCFSSPQGKAYYMPRLVKLALAKEAGSCAPYWQQLLFHLEGDGPGNDLISYCTYPQRQAVARFLLHLIEARADEVELHNSTDELLRVYEYWAGAA